MREKFLIKTYFETIFSHKKNISLKSLEFLPSEIKLYLDYHLKKILALYNQRIFSVFVTPSDKNLEELILRKDKNLPSLKEGEFLLLILPTEKVRYIFQTVVKEDLIETYILKILDPRVEERHKLKRTIPVFFSYITEKIFSTYLTQDFLFVRDSNFYSPEKIEDLKEFYFFDLILNSKEQIDDEFIKIINRVHFKGELIDISRRGLCVKTVDFYPTEESSFFYVRFQLDLIQGQVFKFGLLSHLRNTRQQSDFIYLHLMLFSGFNFKVWENLLEKFKFLIE